VIEVGSSDTLATSATNGPKENSKTEQTHSSIINKKNKFGDLKKSILSLSSAANPTRIYIANANESDKVFVGGYFI
jgi:hypothetical protein